MLQRKIYEIFQGLPNVFATADDILIAGFNDLGRGNNATVEKVLNIFRDANFKCNKDKCQFRCTSISFFGEMISWECVSQDPKKIQVPMDMPPPKCKKELQSFLAILNYLGKFSPVTAEVCRSLRKFKLVKAEWSWNRMYQGIYESNKINLKRCMHEIYDASNPLYLETDASGIGLGACSLQVRERGYELWVWQSSRWYDSLPNCHC